MRGHNFGAKFRFPDQPLLFDKVAWYFQFVFSFSSTDHEWLASAPEADDVDPLADLEEELEANEVVLENY